MTAGPKAKNRCGPGAIRNFRRVWHNVIAISGPALSDSDGRLKNAHRFGGREAVPSFPSASLKQMSRWGFFAPHNGKYPTRLFTIPDLLTLENLLRL